MKVCFPVMADEGTASQIYGHFASAPLFVIVDTDTLQSGSIANCDPEAPLVGCDPFRALRHQALDGIVVGGIGDESVRVMNICGFRVFRASSSSVAENLTLFEANGLPEVEMAQSQLEGRCDAGSGAQTCSHGVH
ncbi:MAG: nitrogenase molybdenum-iron cofactor biosynthesis protein [Coriobacteriia bacterium]|nr:nitrogenase molybdenum-iron cofactor biosynthesis protein [Coriobacteriia bacterium]